MTTKRKKLWEPMTTKGFAIFDGVGLDNCVTNEPCAKRDVPIRIIRENDYKRLLRLARRGK